jgi:hypothetical protein
MQCYRETILTVNDAGSPTSTVTVSPDFSYFDVPRRRLDTLCGHGWDFPRTVFNLNDSNQMKRGTGTEAMGWPALGGHLSTDWASNGARG